VHRVDRGRELDAPRGRRGGRDARRLALRLAKAKITVSGDTARLAKARYVRRGDVWLVDNR
jgi:hypothetical protein